MRPFRPLNPSQCSGILLRTSLLRVSRVPPHTFNAFVTNISWLHTCPVAHTEHGAGGKEQASGTAPAGCAGFL